MTSYPWTNRKQLAVASLVCLLVVERFQYASCMPTTIADELIQQIDGVPVLGRGYTITTNSFQASCFDVNGTVAEHSYNYDCKCTQCVDINAF